MSGATPWGVHSLSYLVGSVDCGTVLPDGRWVRAIPGPYFGTIVERLRVCWWVFTGRAHAIRWPEPGELEEALSPYRARLEHKDAKP